MEDTKEDNKFSHHVSPLEEVTALKELIATIVDYYCFKNNINTEGEEEDFEGEEWKKNYEGKTHFDKESKIIPEDIDQLINDSFRTQLSKYT